MSTNAGINPKRQRGESESEEDGDDEFRGNRFSSSEDEQSCNESDNDMDEEQQPRRLHVMPALARKKRTSLFHISIKVSESTADLTRQQLFDLFSPNADQLVVALRCTLEQHFHVFVRMMHPMSGRQMRAFLMRANCLSGLSAEQHWRGVHCQIFGVRSIEDTVAYITGEDKQPLHTGINPDQFSFFYRIMRWAQHTPKFCVLDPFVCEHLSMMRYVEAVWTAVNKERVYKRAANVRLSSIRMSKEGSSFGDWRDQCVEWWNKWAEEPWYHKKPQLYLHGPSNSGKTTFVLNVLLRGIPQECIFMPVVRSKYAWSEYDERVHRVVLVDCFELGNVRDQAAWRMAMAGESFPCSVRADRLTMRAAGTKTVQIKAPMLFVSNDKISPNHAYFANIMNRVVYVNTAASTMFEIGQRDAYEQLLQAAADGAASATRG